MTPLTTCLWFDGTARQAAEFYVGLFPGAKMGASVATPPGAPGPGGEPLTVEFELMGQCFVGLNGGPMFKFTEAVSFQIHCETQAEIDRYWDALIADGGEASQCGWCKDRFGLSWQVVPRALPKLLADPKTAPAVTAAFMKMQKFDLAALEAAAAAA